MTDKELQLREKKELEEAGEPTKQVRQFIPPVDIFETASAVTVVTDMPGVDRGGVEIHLEDGVLTIKGSATEPEKTGSRRLLLQEYFTGDYMRRFSVAETIDAEKISASMCNGVLTITLPKVAPAQPRRIEVRES